MPFYSFKRNCKVYLVTNSEGVLRRYKLEVYPDLSFSQTYQEESINVKTLHDQNAMFEGAVINRANPANFSFTVLLNNSEDHTVLLNQLVKRNADSINTSVEALYSADLYIDTGVDIFKLEKCVFERATFQISRDSLVTVSVDGTASKLSTFLEALPGTLSSETPTVEAIIPRVVRVDVAGEELSNIAGITLELVNNIEWIDYDTLHKSLNVNSPSDTMYPEVFVVSSKTLSGTIVQYLTEINRENLNSWSTNSSVRIRLGELGPIYYLDVNMPSAVFTNRLQTDEVFTQIYDFRMTANPSNLQTVINYVF